MNSYFEKIKNYLINLNLDITFENEEDRVFVVNDEEKGLKNLVIGCAEPLVILEQYLFDINSENMQGLKYLLEKNREIVHGAFALDESGTKVLFRDTLQIENLDFNELEASINSLSLLLSEHYNELIKLSHA